MLRMSSALKKEEAVEVQIFMGSGVTGRTSFYQSLRIKYTPKKRMVIDAGQAIHES
jgi:hypothetical protein